MIRAFIAVNISDDQRRSVDELLGKVKGYDVRVKWVDVGNLHVTLKFLGDTDEKILPDMYAAIEDSLTGEESFDLSFDGLGCFPNLNRPRVFWVGIENGFSNLKELSRKVEGAVRPFGFEPEKRKFSAHLTIGRVKDPRNIDLLTTDYGRMEFAAGASKISNVVFYQSTLRPSGPMYTPLRTFELNAQREDS